MIYTTYFSNVKNLPSDVVPISICLNAPDGWDGIQYKKLAPKPGFFMAWKLDHDNNFYVKHFKSEVLDALDPEIVVGELRHISKSMNIALVCYERSGFCHRHIVAEWLNNAGFECQEFRRR